MAIRSPICTVAGHVDHGKTSILDQIRSTAVVSGEAGKITQAIGASMIPLENIKKFCKGLLEKVDIKFKIPGLLFIDTPGHAAFSNLRKRGGNLADMAILVIDLNEGFKPQTEEVIEILKRYKTPFIVAANKVDLLPGWNSQPSKQLLSSISSQPDNVQKNLDEQLYKLVGEFHNKGLQAERFDRVTDHAKQVAIVPCSAETKEGIPELLMVLIGLAQRYLESGLEYDISGTAKATILEVKEEKGLGTILDVVLYDGVLKVNDQIVLGTLGEPITTKVKALFEPLPLSEMRDKKGKFKSVKEVSAAAGVRVSAVGVEDAVAGMPLIGSKNLIEAKKTVKADVEEALIETEQEGIIVKADTLGSVEAVVTLLREKEVPIRKATVGKISKKDIAEAESNYEKDKSLGVVAGFNVDLDEEAQIYAKDSAVKVITHDVVYKLIDDLEDWYEEVKKQEESGQLEMVTKPGKIQLLKGYVFRQSGPAVVGVEVMAGVLTNKTDLMKDGNTITTVRELQLDKKTINKAEKGKQVSASLDRVTVGRQIHEGDMLYTFISEEDFRQLKALKKYLTPEDIELLKEIAEIMRKQNPMWGV